MDVEKFIIFTLIFIIGICVGSFMNVVISRLPVKGAFLSKKRSECPACHQQIRWYDLIPIISWIILKGRCRSCGEKISPLYPLVELTTALLTVAAFWRFGLTHSYYFIIVFGVTAVLLAISVIDFQTTEIPDSLIIAIGVFAIAAIWFNPDVSLLSRFIGFFAISLPLLIIAVIVAGAFGGGDIKLMAACGFLLGWQGALLAFFIAIMIGGSYALFLMISGKRKRGEHIVFGPALCSGAAISLFYGNEIISWYLGAFMIY